jgi:hypothetical protein
MDSFILLLKQVGNLPKLQHLQICDKHAKLANEVSLVFEPVDSLQYFTKRILSLNLSQYSRLQDSDWESLEVCPKLEQISLENNDKLTIVGISKIIEMCPKLKKVFAI